MFRHASDCRALIVDDNRDNAESLWNLLQAFGCNAQFTTDPLKALGAVDAFRPHIVFLDIGMPDIDGYQLAHHIRAKYGKEAIRLVALTGYATSSDRARGRVAGFDAHLLKPASPELIESTLTQLFGALPKKNH
jgi:CheY-like chemotaxis protein